MYTGHKRHMFVFKKDFSVQNPSAKYILDRKIKLKEYFI